MGASPSSLSYPAPQPQQPAYQQPALQPQQPAYQQPALQPQQPAYQPTVDPGYASAATVSNLQAQLQRLSNQVASSPDSGAQLAVQNQQLQALNIQMQNLAAQVQDVQQKASATNTSTLSAGINKLDNDLTIAEQNIDSLQQRLSNLQAIVQTLPTSGATPDVVNQFNAVTAATNDLASKIAAQSSALATLATRADNNAADISAVGTVLRDTFSAYLFGQVGQNTDQSAGLIYSFPRNQATTSYAAMAFQADGSIQINWPGFYRVNLGLYIRGLEENKTTVALVDASNNVVQSITVSVYGFWEERFFFNSMMAYINIKQTPYRFTIQCMDGVRATIGRDSFIDVAKLHEYIG